MVRTGLGSTEEPDIDKFRPGDVWESPRGTRYKVTSVAMRVAYLFDETTGQTVTRAYDHIGRSHLLGPWIRLLSGANPEGS